MQRRVGVVALLVLLLVAPASPALAGPTIAELPPEFLVERFDIFIDTDGVVWAKLHPQVPWGPEPPDEWYSDMIGVFVATNSGYEVFAWFQTHDGVSETLSQGTGPDGAVSGPVDAYIMDDGAVLIRTGVVYTDGDLQVSLQSAYMPTETATREEFADNRTVTAAELTTSDDPLHFDGETPVYDLQHGEAIEVVVTTTTSSATTTSVGTTTTTVAVTTTTTLPTTQERPPRTVSTGGSCWWCWGTVALFLAVLLCALFLWLKTYEWWTCWLPWFIVIFAWVPFLLAGLWWWRPTWWWVPLLAWFPLVAGYWWYWARHRTWWKPWHQFVVAGYLVALGVGMVVVGAPEWGLLLPMFWVPWVAFYFWFRGSRQPWFRPWMWGLGLLYLIWGFVWMALLTPWWAWWLPVALVPLLWWWLTSHGHTWRELRGPKWCWALPFTLLPFLAWWIPIWEPWWCIAIVLFLVLHLFCAVLTHFREQEWWSWWLVWFLIGFVWVPFLLAALWFFRPTWWGWAVLPWFVLVPLVAWRWARLQPWWNHNLWYLVAGYVAVAAGASYIVAAPEWGLLFPVFWLPWVGLWLWYRARLQPWWKPWMYAAVLAWVGLAIVWVGWLSPFWGWWFPIALFPFLGWWFMDHGYQWALIHQKSCFLIPWCLAPWMGYMTALYCVGAGH